jgi:hypothetical protein
MQTITSVRSAQAIEVVRLIDGQERNKGSSPFAVNIIAIDVGIVVVLGVPPPLVIRAAPVVAVVVGREQDVKDSGAVGAGDERVTVTLAGVQARHVWHRYEERRASPPPPPNARRAHGIPVRTHAQDGRERPSPLAAIGTE